MWWASARIGVLAILVAGAACVRRPVSHSYRLMAKVLVPPGVEGPDLSRRTFLAAIPPGDGRCPPDGGIELQPAGKKLRVMVDRSALLGVREAGWLAAWSIRGEARGCITAGRGEELAELILESVPMDSAAAARLMNAGFLSGYADLGQWSRLEVHGPLLLEGAALDASLLNAARVGQLRRVAPLEYSGDVDADLAPSVIGFETAWYGLERNTGRAGYHFAALSAERNIQGAVERSAAPAVNYLHFPPQAAFFRLIYKTEANDVLAFVIAGATREDLDRRTKVAASDSAECGKSGGMCLELARRVGVNPFLAVRVNGRDINVRLPASVAAAIREAGVENPDTILPQLRVMKPFHGEPTPVRFDASSREILNLQLSGGEQLSWSQGK
jgi:hypothetical protein